jgi:SAM-dependent methyltransferase
MAEATGIDAAEFRGAQKESWNTVASGWKKHSELIDSSAGHISSRLVELAGVEPGSRVIDVAAGYGEPSLTAAKAAAPDGRVVATDISAGMLAFGRERAEAAGIENIEFVESAMTDLDFPADSFDAALSRWGIIFDPDGEGAAGMVRGLLKPGARFAISSWGPPEKVPFLAIPMGAAMKALDVPPPPRGMPGPLSRPTPEALGGLLEGGGFSDVQVEEAEVTFQLDSPEQFSTFTKEMAAPIRKMIEENSSDVEETWGQVTEAVRGVANDDGTVTFKNMVLLACGTA